MRRLFACAVTTTAALLLLACGGRADDRTDMAAGQQPQGELRTVTGCLSASPQSGQYMLTAETDLVASTGAVATSGTVPTYTYQLTGATELQQHVGRLVEITGHVTGDAKEMEHEDTTRHDPPASGENRPDPKVVTEESIAMKVLPLHVQSVKQVGGTCVGETR
jgi:hypothetical protein